MAPTCVAAFVSLTVIFGLFSGCRTSSALSCKYPYSSTDAVRAHSKIDLVSVVNTCKYVRLFRYPAWTIQPAAVAILARTARRSKYCASRTRYYANCEATFNILITDYANLKLKLSGDIHANPGPASLDCKPTNQQLSRVDHSSANRPTPTTNNNTVSTKIRYTSIFLKHLRFNHCGQLHTSVVDILQSLGLQYRPRGRRAGRSVQKRAETWRGMNRHLDAADSPVAGKPGQAGLGNPIPVIVGVGRQQWRTSNAVAATSPCATGYSRQPGRHHEVQGRLAPTDAVRTSTPAAAAATAAAARSTADRTTSSRVVWLASSQQASNNGSSLSRHTERRKQLNSRHLIQLPLKTNQDLSFYVINSNRIVKHKAFEKFTADVLSYAVDVAAITETWFSNIHADCNFTVPGYSLYRCDRVGREGGGVCCYVKNSLPASQLFTAQHKSGVAAKHELIWLHVQKHRTNYLVAVIYHPPQPVYTTSEFINRLSLDIEELGAKFHPMTQAYVWALRKVGYRAPQPKSPIGIWSGISDYVGPGSTPEKF